MAGKKSEKVELQPPLVPMSDKELQDASRDMAHKIGELEELKKDHAKTKAEMAGAEKTLAGKIKAIASTVRSQGR